MSRARSLFIALGILAGTTLAVSAQTADQARTRYNHGMQLMRQKDYTEGLKDLSDVVATYPRTQWAAEALARMVEYSLATRNFDEARKKSSSLKQYETTFPSVSVLSSLFDAQIRLATSRSKADIDAAVHDFRRLEDFDRSNARIPEARFYTAEALRLDGRTDEAISAYQKLILNYPQSIWTAHALVRYAGCLVEKNKILEALAALQHVRTSFSETDEAAPALNAALDMSTLIYRLHIRATEKLPLYTFRGKTLAPTGGKFNGDVLGVSATAAGQVVVGDKDGVSLFDANGTFQRVVRSQDTTVATFQPDGRLVWVARSTLRMDGEPRETLLNLPPQPDGKLKPIEQPNALAMTWRGEWLVADERSKAIWTFGALSEAPKPFVPASADIVPSRMLTNLRDQVIVLDRDNKTVNVFDRDGASVLRMAPKGQGYQFDNPVDIAVDTLGYLYVLDRGHSSVYVFTPQGALHATFTMPEKDPGAFRKAVAFALDASGRMFIFDDGAHRVQVYQ
jgi:TolA-binding protein